MLGLPGFANHWRERSFDGSFLVRFVAMAWNLLGTPDSHGRGRRVVESRGKFYRNTGVKTPRLRSADAQGRDFLELGAHELGERADFRGYMAGGGIYRV